MSIYVQGSFKTLSIAISNCLYVDIVAKRLYFCRQFITNSFVVCHANWLQQVAIVIVAVSSCILTCLATTLLFDDKRCRLYVFGNHLTLACLLII